MAERKTPDLEKEPTRQGEPRRTPGTAEGGAWDERRELPKVDPGRTPGTAEGGLRDEPPRH